MDSDAPCFGVMILLWSMIKHFFEKIPHLSHTSYDVDKCIWSTVVCDVDRWHMCFIRYWTIHRILHPSSKWARISRNDASFCEARPALHTCSDLCWAFSCKIIPLSSSHWKSSHKASWWHNSSWQDLHDDDKTCMQSSYLELILENGQWLGCWITDGLCALLITGWTGIHGFGYLSPLIWIAPFSAHKLIEQDTAVLHQAIIVYYNFVSVFHYTFSGLCGFNLCTCSL
jgi:hypothetical protein